MIAIAEQAAMGCCLAYGVVMVQCAQAALLDGVLTLVGGVGELVALEALLDLMVSFLFYLVGWYL